MAVMTFGHFLLLATIIATTGWFLAGKFLRVNRNAGIGASGAGVVSDGGDLEWAYCFDVAVRAFFVAFFFLYVVQFLLWPILTRDYWYTFPHATFQRNFC